MVGLGLLGRFFAFLSILRFSCATNYGKRTSRHLLQYGQSENEKELNDFCASWVKRHSFGICFTRLVSDRHAKLFVIMKINNNTIMWFVTTQKQDP